MLINPFEVLTEKLEEIQDALKIIASQGAKKSESKSDNPERLYTQEEVCNLYSVSRVTLWHWEKKGMIKSVRIGNLKRFRENDVLSFIESKSK